MLPRVPLGFLLLFLAGVAAAVLENTFYIGRPGFTYLPAGPVATGAILIGGIIFVFTAYFDAVSKKSKKRPE